MSNFLRRPDIKLVVVDWFGVLSPNFYWCMQSKEDPLLKAWCDLVFKKPHVLNEWMRGKVNLSELLAESGGLSPERALELFKKDMEWYKPDFQLLDALTHLFPNAKKVLATDNFSLFDLIIEEYPDLHHHFAKLYISSSIGLLKADKPYSLFDHILQDQQLEDFRECVLVDDTLENCQAFKSLGGRVIWMN